MHKRYKVKEVHLAAYGAVLLLEQCAQLLVQLTRLLRQLRVA